MTGWRQLELELDAWARAGETATLWWRDDDAVSVTPALRRLIELTAAVHVPPVPLCLAVVPTLADTTLPTLLTPCDHVTVLQHGYAHINNAPAGTKKAEFPTGRDLPGGLTELRTGQERLRALFDGQALPVLVPPWNRIDPAIVNRLPEAGVAGLSTYGPRRAAMAGRSVVQVNTHIDIMNWHAGRRFIGLEAALKLAIDHLAARRQNSVDGTEVTGLLTHHLVHDDDAWAFIDAFLRLTTGHAAVRWLHGREVFGRHGPAREGPA